MLGYLRPEKLRVGIVLESSELASSPKVQSSHRPLRFHFDHRPRLGARRSALLRAAPRCSALLRAAPRWFALLRAAPRCSALLCGGWGAAFGGGFGLPLGLPLLRGASRVLCPGYCML